MAKKQEKDQTSDPNASSPNQSPDRSSVWQTVEGNKSFVNSEGEIGEIGEIVTISRCGRISCRQIDEIDQEYVQGEIYPTLI